MSYNVVHNSSFPESKIPYSRTKEELVQEKNILIIDLQSKQKLLQLQSEIMADDSVYSAMLKDENIQNKRKIEILEEELQNVMSEFQQETRLHEEKFQTELKKNEKPAGSVQGQHQSKSLGAVSTA